ncbi:hypothetical protein ACIA8G_42485 [Lentzea sp. NPDC051213]|uniref:hypothetical protein n=1 Tax=Lentzea sp. NPDC051213 TaxID=3364126 RepID=UPI0037B3F1D8
MADRDVSSLFADYRYYGVFENRQDLSNLDNAHGLIRRPEIYGDEQYNGQRDWSRSRFDERSYDHIVAVSQAGAEHIARRLDRVAWDGWRCHVLSEKGRPFAVVMTKTGRELEFDGRLRVRWSKSDLMIRLPDEPSWSAEETDVDSALPAMAALVRQRRERHRAELTAGWALFRDPVDVLDLGSAYAVAVEPGGNTALPLDEHEAARLVPRLVVRNARRTAELIDGHHYLAVFDSLQDCAAVGTARSLVRCTPDEEHWELFVGDDEWPPTTRPYLEHTLPIGRPDLAEVIGKLASVTRNFDVISPSLGCVAHVELAPGERPGLALRQWRDRPTWYVRDRW